MSGPKELLLSTAQRLGPAAAFCVCMEITILENYRLDSPESCKLVYSVLTLDDHAVKIFDCSAEMKM